MAVKIYVFVKQEIESRLTDCLERGATIEADILANLKAVLPKQIADSIPEPTLPSMSTVEATPEVVEAEPVVEYTSESVAASQTCEILWASCQLLSICDWCMNNHQHKAIQKLQLLHVDFWAQVIWSS